MLYSLERRRPGSCSSTGRPTASPPTSTASASWATRSTSPCATNTTPPGAGGAGDDADVYRWNGNSSYTRVVDASTIGIPATANVDGVKFVSSSDYYLSFSADATVTGLGSAADEDVIHRSGSLWSTYFDGSQHGLHTATNLDVDAFDIP